MLIGLKPLEVINAQAVTIIGNRPFYGSEYSFYLYGGGRYREDVKYHLTEGIIARVLPPIEDIMIIVFLLNKL
jgi:hypothetical protein